MAERDALQESPRRRRLNNENMPTFNRSPESTTQTGVCLYSVLMLGSPNGTLPLPLGGYLTPSQHLNTLPPHAPALAALHTYNALPTPPSTAVRLFSGSGPHVINSISSQSIPAIPTLTEDNPTRQTSTCRLPTQSDASQADLAPNRRALAQQERRAQERAARELAQSTQDPRSTLTAQQPTPPSTAQPQPAAPPSQPTSNRRSLAQQARRARERAAKEAGQNLQGTRPAPPTQLPSPPPTQQATTRSTHGPTSVERGPRGQQPTPPATQSWAQGREHSAPAPPAPRQQPHRAVGAIRPAIALHRLLPAARRPYQDPETRHDLGRMNIACPYCGALHWDAERTAKSRRGGNPEFGICCDHGKVRLPELQCPPATLRALLEADDAAARDFRTNIRAYNSALAFTSLGVKTDDSINRARGGPTYIFRILGQLCHKTGALEPAPGRAPCYAQLYLYDPQIALQQRMNRNNELRADTMAALQNMLMVHNPYTAMFKHAFQVMREHGDVPDFEVRFRVEKASRGIHPRRINAPTADEVAMVLPGDGTAPDYRDILLRRRALAGPPLYRIHEGHPAYSPLHYVLLFPYGEPGWQEELRMVDPATGAPLRTRISQTRFASYRMQVRPGQYSALLRGGRLLQQWLVDMWASADQRP
ncbi:hypothetical protein B0H34DRAFT_190849 [Crassisporium funariophilum]|nr:hypothetical protein B0H34DRAFT_190849 [Crassisporium funariophilum]